MRVSHAAALAAGCLAAVLPSLVHAQAWTRDQGAGYAEFSVFNTQGDQIFNSDGQREPINEFSQTIVSFYGEVGLIDRWLTLTLSSELFRRNSLADRAATQGVGDTQIGLWTGLLESPLRVTFGVVLGVPTGDDQPDAGPDGDPESQRNAATLPTGDGEFDVLPTVLLGYSFGGRRVDGGPWRWPLQHYMVLRAGYWVRTRGFADAIRYELEFGTNVPYTFADRFWLIVRVGGVEAFERPNEAETVAGGLGSGVTFTAISVELSARIWEGLRASIKYDTAPRARGIIAAPPIGAKLSYEW